MSETKSKIGKKSLTLAFAFLPKMTGYRVCFFTMIQSIPGDSFKTRNFWNVGNT